MKIIVAIAFYFLYWGVCFLGTGTDKKNLMGLRSYSDLKDPSVSGFFWLLAKFGDGLMKMQIVNIQFGGRQ